MSLCPGSGNDGLHNAITSVFWWAWNANSGDTGGIVEADWLTINWGKINWMASVGLVPWYSNQLNPGASAESSGSAYCFLLVHRHLAVLLQLESATQIACALQAV